jgi:hypothetical protein
MLNNRLNGTRVVRGAIFDLLTSQCDRHAQNVFLQVSGRGPRGSAAARPAGPRTEYPCLRVLYWGRPWKERPSLVKMAPESAPGGG